DTFGIGRLAVGEFAFDLLFLFVVLDGDRIVRRAVERKVNYQAIGVRPIDPRAGFERLLPRRLSRGNLWFQVHQFRLGRRQLARGLGYSLLLVRSTRPGRRRRTSLRK